MDIRDRLRRATNMRGKGHPNWFIGVCADALTEIQRLERIGKALLDQGTAIHGDELADERTLEQAREAFGKASVPPP